MRLYMVVEVRETLKVMLGSDWINIQDQVHMPSDNLLLVPETFF